LKKTIANNSYNYMWLHYAYDFNYMWPLAGPIQYGSDIFGPKENIGGTNPILEGPKENTKDYFS